jgi:hypothetical protein
VDEGVRRRGADSQACGRKAELQVQPQGVLRLGRHRHGLRHHHPRACRHTGVVSCHVGRRARVDPRVVLVGYVRRRANRFATRRCVREHGRRGGHGGGGRAKGREDAAVGHVQLLPLRPGRGARGEVDPARGPRVGAAEEVLRRREGGDHRVGARVERAARDAAGSRGRGLQLRALELLPLLLVRVLVAAQRLRVGELAAAVLALVPPPVAAGRRGGGGRGGRVGPAAASDTVGARRRRLLRVGLRLHLRHHRLMVVLLGDVETEEFQPGACHTHDDCCFVVLQERRGNKWMEVAAKAGGDDAWVWVRGSCVRLQGAVYIRPWSLDWEHTHTRYESSGWIYQLDHLNTVQGSRIYIISIVSVVLACCFLLCFFTCTLQREGR